MQRVIGIAVLAGMATVASAQQPPLRPQPFPKPATPSGQRPPATPPVGEAGAPADAPDEITAGLAFPGAQYLGSFDATRGQRFYIYGTNSSFLEIVNYYKTFLKEKGELVYEAPAAHMFEVGKFKEETMAFAPSVTVKDYSWNGSPGYLNPQRGAQPAYFKTVIQIVPPVPGT
jgi:hypothetical protein